MVFFFKEGFSRKKCHSISCSPCVSTFLWLSVFTPLATAVWRRDANSLLATRAAHTLDVVLDTGDISIDGY
jgi:hypothetical protein